VQSELGIKAVSVGTVRTTVAVGRASVVAVAVDVDIDVDVGVACSLGKQPAKPTAISITKNRNDFFIYFSILSIAQFYQRTTKSGNRSAYTHTSLIYRARLYLVVNCMRVEKNSDYLPWVAPVVSLWLFYFLSTKHYTHP
jgi:hypothetical protein